MKAFKDPLTDHSGGTSDRDAYNAIVRESIYRVGELSILEMPMFILKFFEVSTQINILGKNQVKTKKVSFQR
jgi:hypothetical protein